MYDKLGLGSSKTDDFTVFVGDNDMGVLSFDESDGEDADVDNEVNLTPSVMSP